MIRPMFPPPVPSEPFCRLSSLRSLPWSSWLIFSSRETGLTLFLQQASPSNLLCLLPTACFSLSLFCSLAQTNSGMTWKKTPGLSGELENEKKRCRFDKLFNFLPWRFFIKKMIWKLEQGICNWALDTHGFTTCFRIKEDLTPKQKLVWYYLHWFTDVIHKCKYNGLGCFSPSKCPNKLRIHFPLFSEESVYHH